MNDIKEALMKLRKEYLFASLDISNVNPDPLKQFEVWFKEAVKSDLNEPNAMSIATASKEGKPSLRVVLLKEYNDNGFIFFTNYQSHKGNNINENQYVALNFFWGELQRQIRIEGRIEKLSHEESDAYYQSRPLGSQIGAWASPQSQKIPNREFLETRFKELELKYNQEKPQRPEHWGGYLVRPDNIEFWQGRENRLHDRILYEKQNNLWLISRLAP